MGRWETNLGACGYMGPCGAYLGPCGCMRRCGYMGPGETSGPVRHGALGEWETYLAHLTLTGSGSRQMADVHKEP